MRRRERGELALEGLTAFTPMIWPVTESVPTPDGVRPHSVPTNDRSKAV